MPPEGNQAGAQGAAGGEDKDATIKKLQDDLAKLQEANGKRDSEHQALKETYERTNALLQSMMENPDRGGNKGGQGGGGGRAGEIDLSDINFEELGIPQKAAEVLVQRTLKVAEQRLESRVVGLTQMAEQRNAFYKKNPDLVGHEFLVGSISQQVQVENPTMPLDKAFELVAKKTREYIKNLQDSRGGGAGSEVPPVAGGGGSKDGPMGGGGGGGEGQEPTPDQELSTEIAERNKIRGRGMGRARSV